MAGMRLDLLTQTDLVRISLSIFLWLILSQLTKEQSDYWLFLFSGFLISIFNLQAFN
jgi:hypothetical protein